MWMRERVILDAAGYPRALGNIVARETGKNGYLYHVKWDKPIVSLLIAWPAINLIPFRFEAGMIMFTLVS